MRCCPMADSQLILELMFLHIRGGYPTLYTLMSVGRKKLSVCQNNVATFSCCYNVL